MVLTLHLIQIKKHVYGLGTKLIQKLRSLYVRFAMQINRENLIMNQNWAFDY